MKRKPTYCPYCIQEISEHDTRCPHCREWLPAGNRRRLNSSMPRPEENNSQKSSENISARPYSSEQTPPPAINLEDYRPEVPTVYDNPKLRRAFDFRNSNIVKIIALILLIAVSIIIFITLFTL